MGWQEKCSEYLSPLIMLYAPFNLISDYDDSFHKFVTGYRDIVYKSKMKNINSIILIQFLISGLPKIIWIKKFESNHFEKL